jgi:hypothetical protein
MKQRLRGENLPCSEYNLHMHYHGPIAEVPCALPMIRLKIKDQDLQIDLGVSASSASHSA